MSGTWTKRRHHCEMPNSSEGDTGDIWRCECGKSWLVLMPGLVTRWFPRRKDEEADRG